MRASLCALAASCIGMAAGQSLTAALSNTVFLNEGVVTSTDERVWVNIPTMYLESENVTCAQCSWGTSSYPYLFYKNGTAPACQPQTPNPGHDAPGNDFTATPLAQDSSSDCQALCCSQPSCTAWTYAPSAPGNYFDCQTGQHCCYQKSGNPPFTNSTIPGIISGYITQPLDAFVPPPLGLRSSVPLGGVGAGAMEVRADGSVHEVTIINASPAGAAKFGVLEDLIVGVRLASAGGQTVARAVRTAPPSYIGVQGVENITYSGSYPISRLSVGDAALPLEVDLFAYSTLEVGNLVASGAPAVFFSVQFTNPTSQAWNASMLLTLPFASVNNCDRPSKSLIGNVSTTPTDAACQSSCAALNGCASWTWDSVSGACALASDVPWSVYSPTLRCGVAGQWFSQPDNLLNFVQDPAATMGGPANGDFSLLPVLPTGFNGLSSVAVGATAADLWSTWSSTGQVGTGAAISGGVGTIGGVSLEATVPGQSSLTLSVVFSWYFPNRDHMGQDIGNYYGTVYDSSVDVAHTFAAEPALAGVVSIINAHHAVFANPNSTAPVWMQDFAINEMSHFRGLIWTLDGRLREFEAMDCPDVDSIHNDYQRHLPYLWVMPEFEYSKMREWAAGQAADGHIQEYLGAFSLGPIDQPGGRVMGDTTSLWITEVTELYKHTGDISFVSEMYPTAARAIRWQISSAEKLGLPYELVCTYDIIDFQQYPTTTFNGLLHLTAMKAGMYLATLMNDNATYALAEAAYTRGTTAMYSLLWNSTYNYFRAYVTGDAIMSDCLYGQMVGHHHGFGLFMNNNSLLQHLAAEAKYNANPYGFAVVTGRNTPPPEAVVRGDLSISTATQAGKVGQDTIDDVNWQGASATWSYMQLVLGNMSVTQALEPSRLSLENWRSRLNDFWNIAGITTSGDWGGENSNGQPYVTSHYGFLLPNYYLFYALSGQVTDIAAGTLSFAPKYACPFNLPVMLLGSTGTIGCNAAGTYTFSLAFGSLSLPASGLSVSGNAYPNAVQLSGGQSVTW